MKKSVLTSLIAASALFTGVAFAGSYTADAGYTSADTSAMAGSENSFLQGLYVGVGVNRTANDKSDVTVDDVQLSAGKQNFGGGFFVGRKFSDTIAVEFGHNFYGKNTYTTTGSDAQQDNYQMRSTTLMGVINSPAFNNVTAHLKVGAAYYNQVTKNTDASGAELSVVKYSATDLAFGFGLQYNIDQFAVSIDWTRIQPNTDSNVSIPDQFGLNFMYNFA